MAGPGRQPTVSDDDILDAFRQSEDPVLSTSEVANAIEMGERGTLSRLKQLANDGEITQKKVGAKATVWWIDDRND